MRGNAEGLTKRQLLPANAVSRARLLRRARTAPEQRLLRALREAFPEAKFRFQVPFGDGSFGPYYADFCSHGAKLIIEVDGDSHVHAAAYDEARTRFLNGEGYQVIRFTNVEVMENLDGTLMTIATHLPFPLVGEGGAKRRMRGRQSQ